VNTCRPNRWSPRSKCLLIDCCNFWWSLKWSLNWRWGSRESRRQWDLAVEHLGA
jgi:hypothetical protein